MGSFAGGEQSATQPPSRLQSAKSPPDVDPDEELLELELVVVEEPEELLELELVVVVEPEELELVVVVDPPQLAALIAMLPAFQEDSESVE
jgi:hypothetical protein